MPSPVCLAPTKSISTSAVGECSTDGLPSRLCLGWAKNISPSALSRLRFPAMGEDERENEMVGAFAPTKNISPSVPCFEKEKRKNEEVGVLCPE